MNGGLLVRAVKWSSPRLFSLICLALILGGCGAQEPPLSKEAQTFKKELLGEINTLTAALVEPVAKEDWEAATPILQSSHEKIEKKGALVVSRMGVLDRNGILQITYPYRKEEHFDFYHFEPVKLVYDKKRKTQAKLYLGEKKIFILMAPLLKKDQVTGAVAVAFSEDDLQNTWKVSEKEFLSIDFNK